MSKERVRARAVAGSGRERGAGRGTAREERGRRHGDGGRGGFGCVRDAPRQSERRGHGPCARLDETTPLPEVGSLDVVVEAARGGKAPALLARPKLEFGSRRVVLSELRVVFMVCGSAVGGPRFASSATHNYTSRAGAE